MLKAGKCTELVAFTVLTLQEEVPNLYDTPNHNIMAVTI
jgi:hypothetical protein